MIQDDLSPSDVPLAGVSHSLSVPVGGENQSVSVRLNGPLSVIHVIHSIPGRVRLRVPALKADSNLVRGLQGLLSAQAGLTEVTVAPVCCSVTVVYDPARWTPESLCIFLQSLNWEELDQYASAALPDDTSSSFAKTWLQPWRFLNAVESNHGSMDTLQTGGPVRSGYWSVGYASMVVGVALFAVPGIPGVPFLILSTYCFSKATIFKTGDGSAAGAQVPKAGQ